MPRPSLAKLNCGLAAFMLLATTVISFSGNGSDKTEEPMAAPSILTVTPAEGSIRVAVDVQVEIQFSEAMNTTTVTYEISPTVTVTPSWPSSSLLRLQPDAPGLSNCTVYGVRIVSGMDIDEGLSLIPGAVPNPWSFMTVCDRPFIVSTIPVDGAVNVRPDTDIVIEFSEPMNCLSLQVIFNPIPLPPSTMLLGCDASRTILTVQLTAGTLFESGTTYAATSIGLDDNGNSLVASLVPNPWSFSVNMPPDITSFDIPAAGCIDADAIITITWTMQDDLDQTSALTVGMTYRNVSGADEQIMGPAQGFGSPASFVWQLPHADLVTRLQLTVTDSAGGVATAYTGLFRIDLGPPIIVITQPKDADRDVPYTSSITIHFSEPMDRYTVENNVTVTPAIPNMTFIWSMGNTTVSISSDSMQDRTSYTVMVGRLVLDTCSPGRPLGTNHSFTFVTGKAPSLSPSSLWQTEIGETTVTLSWNPVTRFVTGRNISSDSTILYRVMMSRNGLEPDQVIGTTGATQITVRDLKASTFYRFRIVAVVDDVPSSPSAPLMIRTRDPFLATAEGQACILAVLAVAGAIAVFYASKLQRARKRAKADAALVKEIQEIVDIIHKVREESDTGTRQAVEQELKARFKAVVGGGRKEKGVTRYHSRLEDLYRALAKELVTSPEVDLAKGREFVDARLGPMAEELRARGGAYRILGEAEASVESGIFRRFPDSGRKALLLVYFYALEDYMSYRLRQLVPKGATILMGERGHLNVRKKDWQARWAGFTLGTLVYIADHNRHFFVEDTNRWEDEVQPLLKSAIEARNRTAHVSLRSPPVKKVRDIVYDAIPAVDAVLKKPKESPK